jgi:hypothetical protein
MELFRGYYGPTVNAFEAAEKDGRADDLREELNTLFESQNTSTSKGLYLDRSNLSARDRHGKISPAEHIRSFPDTMPAPAMSLIRSIVAIEQRDAMSALAPILLKKSQV